MIAIKQYIVVLTFVFPGHNDNDGEIDMITAHTYPYSYSKSICEEGLPYLIERLEKEGGAIVTKSECMDLKEWF